MQERSIPDQQAFVHRWAEEHGYTILRWFTDDAISGTSTKGREAFERMIHEAENGRDFDAVLVYDISRFSRGGSTEMGFFLYRLQQAGVRVIFCAEALPDDDGGELLLGVKSWQAHQYCVKLSRDCIRGAVSSIKVKQSAPGGRAPYGYDRQYRAPDGQVLRTIRHLPDGRKQEFDAQSRHVRFIPGPEGIGKVRSDIVRYMPGDPEHVKTVQRIFDLCARGYGFRYITIALNDDGVARSPRRPAGGTIGRSNSSSPTPPTAAPSATTRPPKARFIASPLTGGPASRRARLPRGTAATGGSSLRACTSRSSRRRSSRRPMPRWPGGTTKGACTGRHSDTSCRGSSGAPTAASTSGGRF
jgi:DNA invertase Pin-like site-specific DNA recombinase